MAKQASEAVQQHLASSHTEEGRVSVHSQTHIPIKNIVSENTSHKIQFREQKGYFQRLRTGLNSILIGLFFLLPFISYQGRQAILLDVSQQQFFFFNITLWPQDFTVLAWVFIAAAFGLFFITVFWGRVWCGFLCPQTAWTFMFAWIESAIEGSSNKRKLLDKAPLSANKLLKRGSKHLLWALVALLTGCGFIAYFVPARDLYVDIFSGSASFWISAWVWFFAVCTYLNAGWMREQMCLHCCPYARFQAVMFDANTKTVSYDASRGENRGPRKRSQSKEQVSASGLGDCVDCHLCVDVCPTGIDIRNGLQYECINCGACVDACNDTMEQFGYAKNLISYVSENQLEGKKSTPWKSYKFIGYGVVFGLSVAMIAIDLNRIEPIQLNIIRDRQSLYRENMNAQIENTYQLKIRNKTQRSQRYQISVNGEGRFTLKTGTFVTLAAGEQLDYPVTVTADKTQLPSNMMPIEFTVESVDESGTVNQETPKVKQASHFFS